MARWDRIIVHADMDAFFAAVEQLDHPELRGKPILVGREGPRSVVTTASYEARPFGVGSAMPLAKAKRRCPDAIVVPPRFSRYKEVSQVVMEVFSSFTPVVEPLSLDEAFLDLSGRGRLFGTPGAMGRRIKEAVFDATGGLNVSVGISTNKFVAKVASDHRKPNGLTVVSKERAEAFLEPLPLERLWGVGPKTAERLRSLGLRTIGDVRSASLALLASKVGSQAGSLQRLAAGVDLRRVEPRGQTKSVSAEETLEADISGEGAIRAHLERLAPLVSARLRRAGLRGRGIRVKLRTADFKLLSRQTTLPQPTAEEGVIAGAAVSLLSSFPPLGAVRLVGVGTFDLLGAGDPIQCELFPAHRQLPGEGAPPEAKAGRKGPPLKLGEVG